MGQMYKVLKVGPDCTVTDGTKYDGETVTFRVDSSQIPGVEVGDVISAEPDVFNWQRATDPLIERGKASAVPAPFIAPPANPDLLAFVETINTAEPTPFRFIPLSDADLFKLGIRVSKLEAALAELKAAAAQ